MSGNDLTTGHRRKLRRSIDAHGEIVSGSVVHLWLVGWSAAFVWAWLFWLYLKLIQEARESVAQAQRV